MKSLAILITPAVSYSIWNHYITNLGLTGQFSFEIINVGTIIRILAGGGDYIQHLTYVKFIRALFTTNLGTGIFSMTYVSAVLLAFCILAVLAYLFRTVVHRGEIPQYAVLFAVGSAGYAFTMLVLYMFCYSEGEMSVLASYERYMSTYILSEYVILFSCWYGCWPGKGRCLYLSRSVGNAGDRSADGWNRRGVTTDAADVL